jgi:hypothetical protein
MNRTEPEPAGKTRVRGHELTLVRMHVRYTFERVVTTFTLASQRRDVQDAKEERARKFAPLAIFFICANPSECGTNQRTLQPYGGQSDPAIVGESLGRA